MTERLLTSLAILKANWDEGRSYLDNFLPFIADVLCSASGPAVTAKEVRDAMESRFGVALPDGVVQTLLKKAARSGYGERTSGTFVINKQALVGHNLGSQRADAIRRLEALLDKLERFAKDTYERELSREAAESALLVYLEDHASSILRAAIRGTAWAAPSALNRETDFIVSRFILSLCERDPQGFEYLGTLIKGSILASVLYLPNPAETERRFERTTLYLDTPLLLRALGYEGPEAQEATRETIELAYQLGARLAAFTDTTREIRGILSAASAAARRPPSFTRGGVHAHFIRLQYQSSDIELLIARLDKDIASLRVKVTDRPPASSELTVDEAALEALLQERLGYGSRTTLLHDLDALTAIYRLRGGAPQGAIEYCRAIFITSNNKLVDVAREFFGADETAVPVALSNHALVTLVWLKRPLASPDLPTRQVIADCYAALEPGSALWSRYLEEIEKLRQDGSISEDDFFFLRYALDAREALMDRTLGEPDNVSRSEVEQILEVAKHAVIKPALDRAVQLSEEARVAEERSQRAETRAATAEQRAAALAAELERREALDESQIRHRAAGWGKVARRVALGTSALLGIVGFVLSLPNSVLNLPAEVVDAAQLPARATFAVLLVLFVVGLLTDRSPRALSLLLEVKVSQLVEARQRQKAGLPTRHSRRRRAA